MRSTAFLAHSPIPLTGQCCRPGHLNCMEFLMEEGADIEQRNVVQRAASHPPACLSENVCNRHGVCTCLHGRMVIAFCGTGACFFAREPASQARHA